MSKDRLHPGQLEQKIKERIETDFERSQEHHRKMRQDLTNGLLKDRRILCIELDGTRSGWKSNFAKFEDRDKKLVVGGLAGGEHDLHSQMFAFQIGLNRDEISYDPNNPDDKRPFVIWMASHGAPPPRSEQLIKVAGVLMTGSNRMVTELFEPEIDSGTQLPWMREVINFSRKLTKRNIPGFYVCFGHQIYSASFSKDEEFGSNPEAGRTEAVVDWIKNPQGKKEREFGPVTLFVSEAAISDPILQGLDSNGLTLCATHSQHVTESRTPDNATVLAHNDPDSTTPGNQAARNQLLAYKGSRTWTIQNHPEITGAALLAILKKRAKPIINEIGVEAYKALKHKIADTDTNRAREILMPNFMSEVGKYVREG